ncbi:MAG: hypothetical protein DIU79_09915, partial [Actinobacteria bacterium]
MPGLTVRALEAGAQIELANRTGRTISVLGYAGEPYLELRPDGVYQNTRSPATYLNQTLAGDTPVPAEAGPLQPPVWKRVSTGAVARWHDHRMHWMEAGPPPQAQADPTRPHRVRDWVIPLRDGATRVEIRGTLDWLPKPDAGLWWVGSLLGALLIAALGVLNPAHRLGRAATVALAAAGALGAACAVLHSVGRVLDAGASSVGSLAGGLLTAEVWPVVTGLGALAAAGYALARRSAADFALASGGACLGAFGWETNPGGFFWALAPAPGAPPLARARAAGAIAPGWGRATR